MRATAQVANDPPNTERGRSGGDEDDRGMNPKHPPGPPTTLGNVLL
jgi:hypothetical protein